MALKACGVSPTDCTIDLVNEVMGARPMKGAAWEQALACAQHYGVRGTLVCPSTVAQLRSWTDEGFPVMIAWNPEGREWSHASVVFDVTDGLPTPIPPECTVMGEGQGPWVWVADTNIPNPDKRVRIVSEDAFYSKWFEKWPNYLVRRPALMLSREITPEGRQVMASKTVPVVQKKSPQTTFEDPTSRRNPGALALIERGSAGAGKHKNKQDFERGHARAPKHKGKTFEEGMSESPKTASDALSTAYWGLTPNVRQSSSTRVAGNWHTKHGEPTVGNSYLVGDRMTNATLSIFRGWVLEGGSPKMRWEDADDGMEWEAYIYLGEVVFGSSADPLLIWEV